MTTRGQPQPEVLEKLVLAAAAAAGLGVWAWATGELAGGIASGRWPRVPASAVPACILGRLPANLGHPAEAWPAAVRNQLPGRWALAVTGLGLVLGVGAVAWAVIVAAAKVRRPARRAPRRAPRVPRSNRPRAPAGPLGATSSRCGSGGRRRAVSSLAWPAGTGWRPRPATPSLLSGPPSRARRPVSRCPQSWSGPGRSWRPRSKTTWLPPRWAGGRKEVPAGFSTRPPRRACSARSGWSPLAEAATWSGAQRVATWMVEATPARSGLSDAAFWYAAAAKQLAPLLLAARQNGATMAEVVRWNNLGDFVEPLAALDAACEQEASVALAACGARDDRIRSSVGTTLETVLGPFEDPIVAAATSTGDIDPSRLLAGPNTLYLCGPSYEQSRVQGLFASLVAAVVAEAVGRVSRSGRPLDPPLLVVLDEAANIAPLQDLDALASTGAGMGIQLVTVVQDLGQLASRYGEQRARTIANNHRAKVVLSGVADLSTLDLLSGLVGDAAVREETVTQDLRDGRRTRATATAFRRLAPTDELRRIPPGTGVLVYGHLPPARIRLRPWYLDRLLRARVGFAAAG